MSLIQTKLIERVKEKSASDRRLTHVLMYGSWATGEGDKYSDIEFWLFVEKSDLPEFDKDAWLKEISPVMYRTVNESGAEVAIFREGLTRGEFHFVDADSVSQIRDWKGLTVTPQTLKSMLILDRTGELKAMLETLRSVTPVPQTDEDIELLCGRFVDWLLFGLNVLERGELSRAHVILGILHGYLAWMARLNEGATSHWLTPSKDWESDISSESSKRLIACSATIDKAPLTKAYGETCGWGIQMMTTLEDNRHFEIPSELLDALSSKASSTM